MASLLKQLTDFTTNFVNTNPQNEYTFTPSQLGISETLVQSLFEFFVTEWKGKGTLDEYMKSIGVTSKNQVVVEYLAAERELLTSSCEVIFSLTGHLNVTDRILYKRIVQNNAAIKRFMETCDAGNEYLRGGDVWNFDTQILDAFNAMNQETGCLFHFIVAARSDVTKHLAQDNLSFFREHQLQITAYEEFGIKCDLLFRKDSLLSPDTRLTSPQHLETALNTPLPKLEFDEFDMYSNITNEKVTIQKSSEFEKELSDVAGLSEINDQRLLEESIDGAPVNDFLEINLGCATDGDVPEKDDASIVDLELDLSYHDLTNSDRDTNLTQKQSPRRFVGMLSSNRFSTNTYQSMLRNTNLANENKFATDQGNENTDRITDKVNAVTLPSISSGSKLLSTNLEPIDPPKTITGKIPDIPDISNLLVSGMKDGNPTIRSHAFSLGEVHDRLSDFLITLRTKEEEASLLPNATRASDSVLRDIKIDWSRISKTMDRAVQEAIKDDADKDSNISQLQQACIIAKNLCKSSIATLSNKLSLSIGAHADNHQWQDSLKSLPKGMLIQGYSNPSIFCYMVAFLNLLNQNPVQRQIYMPSLYNTLSEKNGTIVSNIRTNYNPGTYKELFQVILEKYASVPTTLQVILGRMDKLGMLTTPSTFQDFLSELEKSSSFQGIFNMIDSWVRILSTFYDHDIMNIILSGPHSSSMIAKLKACFIAEKMSSQLLELSSKNPSDQFHELVAMYTKHHMGLQEYVNQMQNLTPTVNKPLSLERSKASRFREVNNLSESLDDKYISKEKGSNRLAYDNTDSINSDLGKTFDALISQNWKEESIPYKLHDVNLPTVERLVQEGVERKRAEIIAKLMLIPCPVCIQYISVNIKEINEGSIYLVPHFYLGESKAYYPPSQKMASCPTFLALDQIERCKTQALLNICEKCTSIMDTHHTCPQTVITCRKNENVNRILCSCLSCMKSINIQRAKCVQVQKEYISSRGQRILMNGGYHNHKANHVVDVANVGKYRETQNWSEGGSVKDLSKGQTDLQLSSIKELEARVKLDTSLQKRLSRFSLVFVKDVYNQDQCLILDTGASCSTMSKAGISKFYHALMDSPVSLKVATGDISIHRESVAALPLADKEKHLAVSFLLVEHKFDPVENVDTTEISNALYDRYVHECLQKGVQTKFNREDFPNNLPETTPIGLLGIRDFQLNVLVSHGGIIALQNCFDSHQKVILAGPLPAEYEANLVRTANINHTDKLDMASTSASDPIQNQGQTKTLTERIKIWLDQRSSSKMKQKTQGIKQRKMAVVKPILKANSQRRLHTMKSLESAIKTFGQLVLKYIPIEKAGDIFMTFGIQTINHLERNARRQRELICGNCGIPYCYHCALQRILLSGDIEVNPGPQCTPLSNKWSKALGFDAVILHASSEEYMCILHSIGMLIPFKTKANPASSAKDLKLKLRDYILGDFVNFLKKAEELSAFKDGIMERLTHQGLVRVTSMSSYKSLFDIPFYFETLEAIALSEFMKISLKIWLNPNLVNEIGQRGDPAYNLFLNTNINHYSPIVKLNGETHSLELKKLDKNFSQSHLFFSDFPPLSKVVKEVNCLKTTNSSQPNEDSKQDRKNDIITITTSGSEEDIDENRVEWVKVSKKKKRDRKHTLPNSHFESKIYSRNEKATAILDSEPQQQRTSREQNLLSTISWQGVKKFNPFGESSLEGGINRSSFSENLPRRTLLKIDNQNVNQTKSFEEKFKQPVISQQTKPLTNSRPSAENLLVEKDSSAHENAEKENPNRPNFFIGFKITGKKFLSDIKIIQDTMIKIDSSLKRELIKPHRMHLTLLALHIEDNKQDLAKAGDILQETMRAVEEFEINLESIRSFDDSVVFLSPKKNDKNLRQINKKLFTAFTNAGYSCDKKFNPHVSIIRGTKLPINDILNRTSKLKMIGSTEFVDRISLNSMRTKDGNDYYKTESTVKLKEILECNNAYFTKDQESTQNQGNNPFLDDSLINESTSVEISLDNDESLIKISHLLEPSQRPKSKNISIRVNIGANANSILKHVKQELKESASEIKDFLVQDECISFLFHTEKTHSEINKNAFRELLAFPANNLDKFKVKKTEGTLFLDLICEDSLDFLKKFTSQNKLSLIRCCIPLIQNNGYHVSSSLIDIDIEKSEIFDVNAPIAINSLSVFEYDTYLNIEKYIGSVGKANPSKILDISINQVRNIIKSIDNTYDKCPGSSIVLTVGEILCVYDGTKFETFSFNQSISRQFINRLKRQLQSLDEFKVCLICDTNDITIDPLIHKITQHGLSLPSEITDCILQDNYCEDCTKAEDRILHMIEAHSDNSTVKNCISFISKTMHCGMIHQDIGDLYLIPEHNRVIQQIKKIEDEDKGPEEIKDMELYFNEIAFNLPDKVLDWETKSLTNVYLSFLMIFHFVRLCFSKRGKFLKYGSIETPNVSENFKLFCPILKNSRSFIKFNKLRTKSKSELQVVPSLDQSRGSRLLGMDRDKQKALALKFHTDSKADMEILKKVRNHCRAYPHVISLTGQLINLAMNITENCSDDPNYKTNLENMIIITGYLTGFLTYNQKSNRAIAPILIEDVVTSLAHVILTGHKKDLIKTAQEVRKRISDEDFRGEMELLKSLPKTRLKYIAEEILSLSIFRFDLDKLTEVPKVLEISPLHVFPNVECYDEVTKVTDTFLFIRSNLEVKAYDTKAAKKWKSQNCILKDDMMIVSNRISGNRTLSEELINQLDKVGICYNLIPLHPKSILFTWVFNACHRNHIRIFERPSTRKEKHSGVPLTLQNFMRAFAMCGQNRILSSKIDKCILCKLRRMHYKTGPLGEFQEQSITQEGLGGMYQIDIIPNIKLSPHGGGTTRQKGSINIGVIVCIDRLTRYVMLEPLRSRDVGQVILSLESIFIKNGMPRVLFCDQESSVLSIARAQGWPMSSSGFLFKETCELSCLFTAATGSAHSQNGIVERMILNIKKSLGGTDYSAMKTDFFAFTQILNTLSDKLNSIPIATKAVKSSNSGLENLLTPDMLFKGLRYRPIELPELKRGTENHKLRENMLLTQNILKTFLIEYFSQNKPLKEEELHPDSKFYQEKWIVAFFLEGNSRPFKRCYDTLKIGRIKKYTDFHNRRPRNAIVEFISLCGSPAIKSKVKIFASKRKVSELIYLFKEDTALNDHIEDEENMVRQLQNTENELINCISIFKTSFLEDEELDDKDLNYLDSIKEISEEYEDIDLNSDKEMILDESKLSSKSNLVDCVNENDIKPQEINNVIPEYDQDLENYPDKIQAKNEVVFDRHFIEETLRQYTMSDYCSVSKCPDCPKCFRCKVEKDLSASEIQEKKLASEDPILMDCIRLVKPAEDDIDKIRSPLRVACRVPLDPQKIHLLGDNLEAVRSEFDNKFAKLSMEEREKFDVAFKDMVNKKVFTKLEDIPKELQDTIMSNKNRHFLSLAPAFKSSSVNTKIRCCLNASKNNLRNVSLNSITYRGLNDLDLSRSFRKFRVFPYGLVGDISRFYNGTLLESESYAYQLISYRKECKPDGEWETYVTSKLSFGIASAAFIATAAITLILDFFRTKCKCFKREELHGVKIGGMDINELDKIDTELDKFNHHDLPTTSGNKNCNAAFHLAESYIASSFVDDLMSSFPVDVRKTVMDTTDYILGFFDFKIKGHDLSNTPADPLSETLTAGKLGVAGYSYSPENDCFQLKHVQIHNGQKFRGKIKRSRWTKEFFYESLDSIDKCTFEYIKKLFVTSETKPTLKLVVSRASSVFDVAGIASPLKCQIVRLLSTFVIMSRQNWNYVIPEDGFDLFLRMMVELAIASFHEYPRFPKNCINQKLTNIKLLWLSDASPFGSCRSNYYLSYKCANGAIGTHLIHTCNKLTPSMLTVPKAEADSLSAGCEAFYKIFLEFEDVITEVLSGTDSRCMIYWTLDETNRKNVFINNRCTNLINILKRLPPKVYPKVPNMDETQGWRNLLFWFAGQEDIMTADLGTKYPLFRVKGGSPLINASKVGPESSHFLGPTWLQQDSLNSLWEANLCRSAAFYQRNTKAFEELAQDVKEDLIPSSKENSLEEEKELLILDEGKELKKMLTLCIRTVTSPNTCKNRLENITEDKYLDLNEVTIPELIESDTDDEDDYDNYKEMKETEISTQQSDNVRAKNIDSWSYTIMSFIAFMLMIHFVSTNENPKYFLTALNCDGPKKLFDLTRIQECKNGYFSAYTTGHQTEKSFLYQPSRIKIGSVSCTIRVGIEAAVCPRINNINKILGSSTIVSGFKTFSDHFLIVEPDVCHKASTTGMMKLKLGHDDIEIRSTNGKTHDFYLGNSGLSLNGRSVNCKPVERRVYLNISDQYALMGGKVVKASITVDLSKEDNFYIMKDDILLTASDEKISLLKHFKKTNITPYLPTVVDKKSTTLFYFDNDYRKVKYLKFNNSAQHVVQYDATNSSLPDLIKLTLTNIEGREIVAALQLSKNSHSVDLSNVSTSGVNNTTLTCFSSQFEDLMMCDAIDLHDKIIPPSPISLFDLLLSKHGGSNSFLQHNIDMSVSGILASLCAETADKMRIIANDFNKLGGLLNANTYESAVVSRDLSEIGELKSCEQKILAATELRNENGDIICCKFLPVKHEEKIRFLKPLSRQLTDVCIIEKCDGELGVTRIYITLNGTAIRQSAKGIVKMNTTKINLLNPVDGLDIFKFNPLDFKEHRQSSNIDDMTQIRLNYAEDMLNDLSSEINNMMQSASAENTWGIELARELLPSFIFWLITNMYGQIILLVIVIYEALRLLFTVLSILFTITDIIRRKPNNKLEHLINSSTASRRETAFHQQCMDDIQTKLIGDMVSVQAQLRYHSRRIAILDAASRRTEHKYYNEQRYSPLNQTNNSDDDQVEEP